MSYKTGRHITLKNKKNNHLNMIDTEKITSVQCQGSPLLLLLMDNGVTLQMADEHAVQMIFHLQKIERISQEDALLYFDNIKEKPKQLNDAEEEIPQRRRRREINSEETTRFEESVFENRTIVLESSLTDRIIKLAEQMGYSTDDTGLQNYISSLIKENEGILLRTKPEP